MRIATLHRTIHLLQWRPLHVSLNHDAHLSCRELIVGVTYNFIHFLGLTDVCVQPDGEATNVLKRHQTCANQTDHPTTVERVATAWNLEDVRYPSNSLSFLLSLYSLVFTVVALLGATCQCSGGFTQRSATEPCDRPCGDIQCENSGVCNEAGTGCVCQPGYYGTECESCE